MADAGRVRPQDLRIDVFRGGGISVRVTHLPTGTVALCEEHSTEAQCRECAMRQVLTKVAPTGAP